MRHIHSVQNSLIKDVVKLRERRGRRQQNRIMIDGCRETQRAIDSGLPLANLFIHERLVETPISAEVEQLLQSDVEATSVTAQVYRKIAFGDRDSGIVATAETPQRELADLVLPPNPLVSVLEAVEKPGNLGAIARTADGAGCAALLLADPVTDIYNPNAIRASQGALFSLQIVAAPTADVIDWLRARSFTMFAARVDAASSYDRVDLTGSAGIVLGNEATGLSSSWEGEGITPISLPMLGISDSLNVSATAAILMYESRRQRSVALSSK